MAAINREEIYKRHAALIMRVCRSYFKCEADAEDAAADTVVKLLSYRGDFRDHEHEKAWLIRVAANVCKSKLRRRRPESLSDYPSLAAEEHWEDSAIGAVLALEDRYKMPVYLHYYEGYSTEEIAKILGIPSATVRWRLRRAREILKPQLA